MRKSLILLFFIVSFFLLIGISSAYSNSYHYSFQSKKIVSSPTESEIKIINYEKNSDIEYLPYGGKKTTTSYTKTVLEKPSFNTYNYVYRPSSYYYSPYSYYYPTSYKYYPYSYPHYNYDYGYYDWSY